MPITTKENSSFAKIQIDNFPLPNNFPILMRKALNASIAGLVLLVAGTAFTASATAVFFPGTDHWYEAVQVPAGLTWNQACSNAVVRGGYLCTITNAEENTFAASLVDISYYSDLSVNNYILGPWLGGFRRAGESNWQWLTGEPFAYANWHSGQPDGYGGSEQRLQFYNGNSIGSTWGDHPGDPIPGFTLPRGYIVEYDHPRLFISQTNNNLVAVSWPQPERGWVLETTPELSVSNVWTQISNNQYQTNLTDIFDTITNRSAGNAFYRLRHD